MQKKYEIPSYPVKVGKKNVYEAGPKKTACISMQQLQGCKCNNKIH